MRSLEAIERELDIESPPAAQPMARDWLLGLAEETLEAWVSARGESPTADRRDGFRLLALHHQGARGNPSFNACRETCREIAYHYNLLASDIEPAERGKAIAMMTLLVRHLVLFVGGKLQVEGLGEFCCASRPIRTAASNMSQEAPVGESNA